MPPPPRRRSRSLSLKVAERFANPKIGDTIARLCFDGSNRQPKFILPTVVDRLKAGASVKGLALVSAMWCRYCYGETESGKAIPPNDPTWDRLQAAAKAARDDPTAFLAMRDIFGELADAPAYVAAFSPRWRSCGRAASAPRSTTTSPSGCEKRRRAAAARSRKGGRARGGKG